MSRAHPAVDILARTEGLWESSERTARDRAMLMVQHFGTFTCRERSAEVQWLIETGHLTGNMRCEVPLAADDASPAPVANDAHTK